VAGARRACAGGLLISVFWANCALVACASLNDRDWLKSLFDTVFVERYNISRKDYITLKLYTYELRVVLAMYGTRVRVSQNSDASGAPSEVGDVADCDLTRNSPGEFELKWITLARFAGHPKLHLI
jgi:hypothetical protein